MSNVKVIPITTFDELLAATKAGHPVCIGSSVSLKETRSDGALFDLPELHSSVLQRHCFVTQVLHRDNNTRREVR